MCARGSTGYRARAKRCSLSLLAALIVGWLGGGNAAGAETLRAVEERSLGLKEAEQIALGANPENEAAASYFKLSCARVSEEKAKRLPTVKFLENYAFSNNPVFAFSSLLMQQRFTQNNLNIHDLNRPSYINNFFTAAFVHVPIFQQLQTSTSIARGNLARTRATRERDQVRQKIRLDLVKAFYGVLVAQSNEAVARSAVQTAEAELKRMKDLSELGSVVRSDELAMAVQLSEFKQQQLRAHGDFVIARAELNKVLGSTVTMTDKVDGQLTDKVFSVPAEEEAVLQALRARPDYVQSELLVKEKGQAVKAAYGKYLPKIDGYGAVIQDGNAIVNGGTSLALSVNMTLDLFDWKKPAQVREAKAEREMARANLKQMENQVRLDVIRALENFTVASQKREVASMAAGQAEEALRIIRDRYKVGLTQITELLRAETALVRAQTNLLAARYDYYIGYAELLKVTGKLTDVASFAS